MKGGARILEYNLRDAAGEPGDVVAESLAIEPVRKCLVNPFALAGNFTHYDVGACIGIVEKVVAAKLNRENFTMQEHTYVGSAVV